LRDDQRRIISYQVYGSDEDHVLLLCQNSGVAE